MEGNDAEINGFFKVDRLVNSLDGLVKSYASGFVIKDGEEENEECIYSYGNKKEFKNLPCFSGELHVPGIMKIKDMNLCWFQVLG